MRIIATQTLRNYIRTYPKAEQSLLAWNQEAESAHWDSPNELKGQYRNASILSQKRVVFNIRGNHYRLVVDIEYRLKSSLLCGSGRTERMIKLTQETSVMIGPIKNNEQYDRYLGRIYELTQADMAPDSKESDELEVLSILVKDYENVHFPVPKPSPLEAIRFRLEQMGISEKELSEILGYRSRKSEILSGKRKLNLSMIRRLNEKLHIPAEILIQAY